MGTSQSKPPLRGGKPLVPSWGDQDPPPGGPPDGPQELPADDADLLPRRALTGTRRALRDYYGSGSRADGRKSAARFARSAGAGGARRYARATRTGGAVLAGMLRAAGDLPPEQGAIDIRSLAGRPVEEAIAEVVDAFCPPGTLDEEAIRLAVAEALFEALGNADEFRPEAMSDLALLVATRCFVAEIVFASMMSESGRAASDVSPELAVTRENGLRDLIREVADHVGTPLLQGAGALVSANAVQQVVARITEEVLAEMRGWE